MDPEAQDPCASPVTDNREAGRFELEENGLTAFADYVRRGDVVILPHVEAPPGMRGGGAAGRLMRGVLDRVRAEGLKVRPTCSYAAAFIRRSAEDQDLLA